MPREQKLELVQSQRGTDYYDVASAAFKTVFPGTVEEVVRTAAHHVYTDDADAALNLRTALLKEPPPLETVKGLVGSVT